jgi:hypothetical protein
MKSTNVFNVNHGNHGSPIIFFLDSILKIQDLHTLKIDNIQDDVFQKYADIKGTNHRKLKYLLSVIFSVTNKEYDELITLA